MTASGSEQEGAAPVAYIDTSALAKLLLDEPEARPLRAWFAANPRTTATSVITEVELVRAVRRGTADNAEAVSRARELIRGIWRIPCDRGVVLAASALEPTTLRSLDAIHLASALAVGGDLLEIIAYDARLLDAARVVGLATASPR